MYEYKEIYKDHVLVSYGWRFSPLKDGEELEILVYLENDFNRIAEPYRVDKVEAFFPESRVALLTDQGLQGDVQREKDQERDKAIIRAKQKIDTIT